jgi:hypothetical protein
MRVLLLGIPNLLAGIIRSALADSPIILLDERLDGPDDLSVKVKSTGADAVIMRDGPLTRVETSVALLKSFPSLKVVVISKNGRSGTLRELRLHTVRIKELSTGILKRVLLEDTGSLHMTRE